MEGEGPGRLPSGFRFGTSARRRTRRGGSGVEDGRGPGGTRSPPELGRSSTASERRGGVRPLPPLSPEDIALMRRLGAQGLPVLDRRVACSRPGRGRTPRVDFYDRLVDGFRWRSASAGMATFSTGIRRRPSRTTAAGSTAPPSTASPTTPRSVRESGSATRVADWAPVIEPNVVTPACVCACVVRAGRNALRFLRSPCSPAPPLVAHGWRRLEAARRRCWESVGRATQPRPDLARPPDGPADVGAAKLFDSPVETGRLFRGACWAAGTEEMMMLPRSTSATRRLRDDAPEPLDCRAAWATTNLM